MATLEQIAADLAYAAGAGGNRLAQGAVANARTRTEIGAALRRPTPSLTALVGRRKAKTVAESIGDATPAVDVLASELGDGGALLAMGVRSV